MDSGFFQRRSKVFFLFLAIFLLSLATSWGKPKKNEKFGGALASRT
jgi:hypothetical protein